MTVTYKAVGIPDALPAVDTINDPDVVLTEWKNAKAALDYWKARETLARAAVIRTRSKRGEAEFGTENLDIGFGHTLKITRPVTLEVSNADDYQAVKDFEDDMEKSEVGQMIVDRLIKWKPSISKTEYDLLSGEHKARVNRFVTIKPGSVSVELKAPKAT